MSGRACPPCPHPERCALDEVCLINVPAASRQDEARRVAAKVAAYIGALKAHDWDYEFSDDQRAWWRGNASFAALKAQQFDLDPDLRIWNEHAPEQFRRKA